VLFPHRFSHSSPFSRREGLLTPPTRSDYYHGGKYSFINFFGLSTSNKGQKFFESKPVIAAYGVRRAHSISSSLMLMKALFSRSNTYSTFSPFPPLSLTLTGLHHRHYHPRQLVYRSTLLCRPYHPRLGDRKRAWRFVLPLFLPCFLVTIDADLPRDERLHPRFRMASCCLDDNDHRLHPQVRQQPPHH
jgi:hypothetical protein